MIEKSFEAELVDSLVGQIDMTGVVGSRERHRQIAKRLGVSLSTLYDLSSETGKQRIGLDAFFKLIWLANRQRAQEFFTWLSNISDGSRTELSESGES